MLGYEKRGRVLNAFPIAKPLGFSLVELMIGIVIAGFLLMLGIPSYTTWIQNTQIRNAAESIQNGMHRARAEAVSRNANVEFVLGAGSSVVRVAPPDGAVIEWMPINDGSSNVTIVVTPIAILATITFNNFGGVLPTNADGTAPFTQVDLDSTRLTPAQSRDLRITVGVGGNARMCDPNMPASIPPSPIAC